MAPRRSVRLSAANLVRLARNNGSDVLTSDGTVTTQMPPVRKREGLAAGGLQSKSGNDGLEVPSTPKKRKRTNDISPSIGTPAAAKMMALPYSSGDIDGSMPTLSLKRVADPLTTNAPLISPGTSRVVANKTGPPGSPSKSSAHAQATTGNILEKALAHLIKTEPRLKPVIEKHNCTIFSPESLAEEIDPFRSLTSGIISQQVSGAAARSIKAKFVALFNADASAFPTPAQVVSADIDTLRTAGLSQRKAEYIRGLAEKFANGELSTEMLLRASYDEVLEKLVAVRGLGRWSVEMFACFGLKRMDIFSTGDLGVQRGMATFMGKDVGKLKAKGGGKWKYMSEIEMLEISAKFAPYRSVFMWYMWRIEDVDVRSLDN